MHIGGAYCVEVRQVVDIYGARASFFAQEKPRNRFRFLCSDTRCRTEHNTKVIGINYDKLVEEGDRFVLTPHFRTSAGSAHADECEWVAGSAPAATSSGSSGRAVASENGRFRRIKASDMIDTFSPNLWSHAAPQDRSATVTVEDGRVVGPGTEDSLTTQTCRSVPRTRSALLEPIVRAYELLEPNERREARLLIAGTSRMRYSTAFCHVEHYERVRGPRIFYGGVWVQLHGPNFAIRFFDQVRAPSPSAEKAGRQLTLYLKRDALFAHWNGRFLIEQLAVAAQPGHYAHCYFFGRLEDHPRFAGKLVVCVESLDHLVFIVRRRLRGAFKGFA